MPAKPNVGTELENINKLIAEIKNDLEGKATTEVVNELLKEIRAKDKRIEMLESQVAVLQNSVELLTAKCDDNEQYSRRLSLRINNVPLPAKGVQETAADVLNIVKGLIGEAEVDVPHSFLDRAHRVGKVVTLEDGSRKQQIIAKFTTWHHRTILYRGRKNLSSAKIFLDLTRRKFALLKRAQEIVKSTPTVDFVFSDVNCALCARTADGKFRYFNSEDQLEKIVAGK